MRYEFTRDDDRAILSNIKKMEVVNPLWTTFFESIEANLDEVQANAEKLFQNRSAFLDHAIERFATYLIFRYQIEIFYKKNPDRTYRFMARNFRILMLLLGESMLHEDDRSEYEVIVERARIFSRQIEHSDTNVEILIQ
jgi:hypothetical protein